MSSGMTRTELSDALVSENRKTMRLYPTVEPEKLLALIQELPEGYRTVLNLFVFEGYTHKEIAESLGISESTSKTQLFKARELFAKQN